MNNDGITNVSVSLQRLANEISAHLRHAAGEPVGFTLVVATGDVMQYISNCSREDGVTLLKGMLAQWEEGSADIPAHINPDLNIKK